MIKAIRSLIRQMRCRRHRWRPDRRRPGGEWCDLCHARRVAPGHEERLPDSRAKQGR